MNLNPGQRGIECSPTVFEGRRNANKIPASPKRMKSQRIVNFGFNGFGADNDQDNRVRTIDLLFQKHAQAGLRVHHIVIPRFLLH